MRAKTPFRVANGAVACQQPLAGRAKEEWWAGMEEVFHLD
jgi:L-rhamnose mutarotase